MNGKEKSVVRFPIEALPKGEFAPPLSPDHPTWEVVAPWTDPLADRGAYRVASAKERITDQHGPAVQFGYDSKGGRALILEDDTLRDGVVSCRLRAKTIGTFPNLDGFNQLSARAGIVFRMETIRRHYFFCVEDATRLVLYRRDDDDWHVLHWTAVTIPDDPITLRVELDGGAISASCPELDVTLAAIDDAIPSGKAGFRTIGETTLYELNVETSPEQRQANSLRADQRRAALKQRGGTTPDAVPAGEWDLTTGEPSVNGDFVSPGRNDLLWKTTDGIEARTWEGETIWRFDEKPVAIEMGLPRTDGSRRLYLLTGERCRDDKLTVGGVPMSDVVADRIVILDGATGEKIVEERLPDDPQSEGRLLKYDFSFETGFASNDDSPDFLVRQWRQNVGGGGSDLWAYDANANLLWHRDNETFYGHHNAVHWADVNRDGNPEILAGGTCLDAKGNLIWTHDQADEMRRYRGGEHYDAVLVQPEENWPHSPPLAFLAGGSAGVYVIDATTGRTLSTHRVGHAQWGMWCDVIGDQPGQKCLIGTRWGNYGILTLFSVTGKRLWSIQPDYVLQGSRPVRWAAEGPQHIWINTSERGMGLYDGEGNIVNPLEPLRKTFAGQTRMTMPAVAFERRPGGRHWLALRDDQTLRLFKPEDDA